MKNPQNPVSGPAAGVGGDYAAESLDNAMAWSADDFLLVNGTNVLPFFDGRPLEFAAEVVVHTDLGWLVATGMTPAGGAGTYRVTSYHDLVDMALFLSLIALHIPQVDCT